MDVERRVSKDLINPLSRDYLSSYRVRKILDIGNLIVGTKLSAVNVEKT